MTNPVTLLYNEYTIEPNGELVYDAPSLTGWDRFVRGWNSFWRSDVGKIIGINVFLAATLMAVLCPTFAPIYVGTAIGVGITLGIGGAIAGYRSRKQGSGFWEGFGNYINENWSQTVAISYIIAMLSFGVSQAVAAVRNAIANKQLANAVVTSQEAALARAKDLQKLPNSKRPRATSAAIDIKSGSIYYGDSGFISNNINPVLATNMPLVSRTSWVVQNCAEFNAVNNALNAGVQLGNLVVTTIKVKTLTFMPMCANCMQSLQGVLLVVSG